MICNPYALFLYLLEKEEYQDYTHTLGCLRTSRITENKLKNTKNIRTCDL